MVPYLSRFQNLLKWLSILSMLGCNVLAAEVLSLAPGLSYQRILYQNQYLIHYLTATPAQYDLILSHDASAGTLETFALRSDAVAAINGGFFSEQSSGRLKAAGVLKVANNWLSPSYQWRSAIAWSNTSLIRYFGPIETQTRLEYCGQQLAVHAFNQEGRLRQNILFTREHGLDFQSSPESSNWVIVDGFITECIQGARRIKIPTTGMVYSIGRKSALNALQCRERTPIHLNIQATNKTPHPIEQYDYILGAGPLLIADYASLPLEQAETFHPEFLQGLHARSVIGQAANGSWVFVMVEGSFLQTGISLNELANFLKKQGVQWALNLDGGSSSGFYLAPYLEKASDHGKKAFMQLPINNRLIANVLLLKPKLMQKP